MPPGAPPAARPLRDHWPAAVLAVVAAVLAVVAHRHLFPALSWNRDEPVYLWNVEILRQGQLTATDGGHPDLFLPWLSAAREGMLFTQYTPGWPLVLLVARLLTGTAASALPVGAALAVVGTYALAFELSQRRRLATLAAALLVASPILPIQGGVYLSYLFTLGLGTLVGALMLSGHRRSRYARLVVAGALLGWIFLTRPYDALLWGGAYALGLLVVHRAAWASVVRSLVVVAGSAIPLVVVTLLYNRHVTGELLTFPITVADPLDGFGFGDRRLMPGLESTDYTPWLALRSTLKNAALLPWFLVGGYLTIGVAIAGAWYRRRDPLTTFLVCLSLAFPLGYFVFWGTYLSSLASRISGPIYFVPLYAAVCILAAAAVDRWWSRRPATAFAALAVLAVATVPGAVTRFDVNRQISLAQEPWRTSVADLEEPALVAVADTAHYLLYSNPFSANAPDLDGDVLYAVADDPSLLELIAEQPHRHPYLQQGSVSSEDLGPREDPQPLDVVLTPIEVVDGNALDLHVGLPTLANGTAEVTVDTGAEVARFEVTGPSDSLVVPLGGSDGAVEVADEGRLTISARLVTEDGTTSSYRRLTPYRLVEDRLEVVTPFTGARIVEIADGIFRWRYFVDPPQLTVEVRPSP